MRPLLNLETWNGTRTSSTQGRRLQVNHSNMEGTITQLNNHVKRLMGYTADPTRVCVPLSVLDTELKAAWYVGCLSYFEQPHCTVGEATHKVSRRLRVRA
jgi:hypothetical protein